MNKYELWSEGYLATGMEGIPATATFHGVFEGETFKDAIQAYKDTLRGYDWECVDVEEGTLWGCRFFDNEADARKLYG